MNNRETARHMRGIVQSLRPNPVDDVQIVEASPGNWMALAVMRDGPDRRFRFQGGRLYDESIVGDVRIA